VKAAKRLRRDRVDGVVDGGQPFVKREAEVVVKITGQEVGFLLSDQPNAFAHALEVGLETVRSTGSIPRKLLLACEVYSQTHFLSSGFARFLALFMPLEIAAPDDVPGPIAVAAQVGRWAEELRLEISRRLPSDPARRELEVLSSRLGQLKKQSHSSRIQEFVATKLRQGGRTDADKEAEEIIQLYSVRGSLTHAGVGDVSNHLPHLEEIVCDTLKFAIEYR
jgi:hypothetical protein